MEADSAEKIEFNQNMQKLAAILFFAGLLLILLHTLFLKSQNVFNDESWKLVIESTHDLKDSATQIYLQPPFESQYIRHIGRNIRYTGMRLLPPASSVGHRRAIRFSSGIPGKYQLSAEFSMQLSSHSLPQRKKPESLNEKKLDYYLQQTENGTLSQAVISRLFRSKDLDVLDAELKAKTIFEYIEGFADRDKKDVRKYEQIIESGLANQLEKMLLLVELARYSGLPARLVTGVELKDDPSAEQQHWAEIMVDNHWQSFYLDTDRQGDLPYYFLALDKSGKGVVSSSLPHEFEWNISVERVPVTLRGQGVNHGKWYQVFIIDRLSLETREQLALLMLLPLGTLLTGLVRQLLKVHSYGVFTPTILALAFIYAETGTTLLILFTTLCLVYLGRPTFHSEMSRTPRLSIIFTLVAFSMIVGVSILDYLNIATDGQLVLLPIVIITSLLDRFFSTIESRGYHSGIIRLVWTLLLTIIVLPVLHMQQLGMWLIRYPEAHLITLSILLMMTYYPLPVYKLPGWLSFLSEPTVEKNKSASVRDESAD